MTASPQTPASKTPTGLAVFLVGLAAVLAISAISIFEVYRSRPIRQAVGTYYRVVAAVNREDWTAASSLLSARMRQETKTVSPPGARFEHIPGIVEKEFRVWRDQGDILLCPTRGGGTVFRLSHENGQWLFDGSAGTLDKNGSYHPG